MNGGQNYSFFIFTGELNRLDMDQDDITTSERMEKGEEELNKEDADLKPVVVLDKKEEEDVQDDSEMENKLGLDVENYDQEPK